MLSPVSSRFLSVSVNVSRLLCARHGPALMEMPSEWGRSRRGLYVRVGLYSGLYVRVGLYSGLYVRVGAVLPIKSTVQGEGTTAFK